MTRPPPPKRARKSKQRLPLPKTIAGRRRLTAVLVLLGALLAGYLTTCALYPSPLLRADRPVARVVGKAVAEAEEALTDLGFKVKILGEVADPEVPAGHVVWQEPPPDLVVAVGTTVQLTRSSGAASVAVPDVTDFDLDQARRVMAAAGLKIGDVDSVPSQVEAGVVLSTRPNAGTGRLPGNSVDLVVSRGPATIRVPNVVGASLAEARLLLEEAGLGVGKVSHQRRRGPAGVVVEQRPKAGTMNARSGRIDLVISETN